MRILGEKIMGKLIQSGKINQRYGYLIKKSASGEFFVIKEGNMVNINIYIHGRKIKLSDINVDIDGEVILTRYIEMMPVDVFANRSGSFVIINKHIANKQEICNLYVESEGVFMPKRLDQFLFEHFCKKNKLSVYAYSGYGRSAFVMNVSDNGFILDISTSSDGYRLSKNSLYLRSEVEVKDSNISILHQKRLSKMWK